MIQNHFSFFKKWLAIGATGIGVNACQSTLHNVQLPNELIREIVRNVPNEAAKKLVTVNSTVASYTLEKAREKAYGELFFPNGEAKGGPFSFREGIFDLKLDSDPLACFDHYDNLYRKYSKENNQIALKVLRNHPRRINLWGATRASAEKLAKDFKKVNESTKPLRVTIVSGSERTTYLPWPESSEEI